MSSGNNLIPKRLRNAAKHPGTARALGAGMLSETSGPIGASESLRKALAVAWLKDAADATSAADRAKWLALELVKLRAPNDLVGSTLSVGAAHMTTSRMCVRLARRYSFDAVALITASERPERRRDLIAMATTDCLAVSLVSAHLAHSQLAVCKDPYAREVLVHRVGVAFRAAHLATRILSWLVELGGARVRPALADGFREAMGVPVRLDVSPPADEIAAWHAHGRLLPAEIKLIEYASRRDHVAGEAALLLSWNGVKLQPAA